MGGGCGLWMILFFFLPLLFAPGAGLRMRWVEGRGRKGLRGPRAKSAEQGLRVLRSSEEARGEREGERGRLKQQEAGSGNGQAQVWACEGWSMVPVDAESSRRDLGGVVWCGVGVAWKRGLLGLRHGGFWEGRTEDSSKVDVFSMFEMDPTHCKKEMPPVFTGFEVGCLFRFRLGVERRRVHGREWTQTQPASNLWRGEGGGRHRKQGPSGGGVGGRSGGPKGTLGRAWGVDRPSSPRPAPARAALGLHPSTLTHQGRRFDALAHARSLCEAPRPPRPPRPLRPLALDCPPWQRGPGMTPCSRRESDGRSILSWGSIPVVLPPSPYVLGGIGGVTTLIRLIHSYITYYTMVLRVPV